MLNKIREQRDRWQQRAEQLAAFSITDQRKEVFLVFWGCSECTVSQRFFLYQVGNRTHTPPDASIAQLAPIVIRRTVGALLFASSQSPNEKALT